MKDGDDYSVHLMDPDILVKWESVEQVVCLQRSYKAGPSCSKLTTSLVNYSFKFTSNDTQIC